MFWRVAPLLRRGRDNRQAPVRIAAVIPARDEQDLIGQAVDSLLRQQLDGTLRVWVVDDNSADGTAKVAAESGAKVVPAGPLPDGWTGKLWAQSQGVKAAAVENPDFFLFTDADIVHGSTNVQHLIDCGVAMASVMVRLRCESIAERLLIPAFVFFFFKLYPPRWIANPKSSTAGAAGGCILIRSEVLATIGGVEAIRNQLIDDCALAAAVKPHGAIWLGLSKDTYSIRPYESFHSIWNMIARTAFTQLQHSSVMLMGAIGGMTVTYLAPPFLAMQGHAAAALAWILLSAAYMPMLLFYRQPIVLAPLLPFTAMFYLGATIHSAIRYWSGIGGQWKGRVQDARQ